MASYFAKKGKPKPLGTTITEQGVNFALFSKNASKVTLCFLDPQTKKLYGEIHLDPEKNKTGNVWHVFVEHLVLPMLYAYHIDGERNPKNYFDPQAFLLDPYAKSVLSSIAWGQDPKHPRTYHPYGVLTPPHSFDWEGINSPKIPSKDLVIYEMHVRGFTKDPSSEVEKQGSFLGVIEKIPYLKDLGINAIELLPVFEFNECEYHGKNPKTKERLYNYWGYSTIHFFSPMNRYVRSDEMGASIREFKTMVKELHRNEIEVILDVVFNHTGEKKKKGGAYSFMGIDRASYYLLTDSGDDYNYTGCGNTMNLNHPVIRQFVKDCLQYWVTEMHVDGFRFDLASIMNRDMKGRLLGVSPLIETLTHDPVLAETKLIAEPWDSAGAYQLGDFYPEEERWSEWNGKYRDSIRSFMKGDHKSKNEFAGRISGSQDYFPLRTPYASINFFSAHDGFCLQDLVSYNDKHNLANGENNRDGNSYNISWNSGEEGKTDNQNILSLREKRKKNFMLGLLVSQGIPMILMGDEKGQTRKGNNNPWCQDNPINWLNWHFSEEETKFYSFVKKMITFRKNHEILRRGSFFGENDIYWHGIDPEHADWDDERPILAFTLKDQEKENHLYVAMNATPEEIVFQLPNPPEGKKWKRIVDTSLESPEDFIEEGEEIENQEYLAKNYSTFLLKAF